MLSPCASSNPPRRACSGHDALTRTLPLEGFSPPPLPSRPSLTADWSEEELVYLHWRLLQDVAQLADPLAPLAEKFDTLRWVFTEPHHDPLPFSFANCLRVVANSPLSPIGYCGTVDVEDVRDRLRQHLRRWFDRALDAYPAWVRQLVHEQPGWVEAHLDKNPQWLNEQLKAMAQHGDLFS